jgi:ribulose-phosphate 3-epimerase
LTISSFFFYYYYIFAFTNEITMKRIVAPSLLAADFSKLGSEIEMVNKSEADWLHLDIMDGVFVPNISFGFPVLKFIKELSGKPLDIHLMIVQPERYLQRFAEAGAYRLTVHYEACVHLHRVVEEIKDLGIKAGVTLNPHTPVHLLEDIITELDLVLIMSVNPGFGGQHFIENTYTKITELKKLIERKKADVLIEVDGGIDTSNAGRLYNTGANALVTGTTVFSSDNPMATIRALKNA